MAMSLISPETTDDSARIATRWFGSFKPPRPLRLGAASLGAPLLAPSTTPLAAADRPAQVNTEATPLSDFPTWEAFPLWEGEDYPGHPDPRARTINNLKFMGLAMHNFAAMNGGRFPAAAIRKGDKAS